MLSKGGVFMFKRFIEIMNSSGLDDYEKQYSDTYCDVYLFK